MRSDVLNRSWSDPRRDVSRLMAVLTCLLFSS